MSTRKFDRYMVAIGARRPPVSPRRCMDTPDLPGGPSSDFEGAVA